jgi:hypothetical protein
MMILDAIDSAGSEHAILFLVTAYIESLRHFPRGLGVPESVIKLPVAGVGDLEDRLTALRHHINVPLEAVVPASEVSAVLASAVQKLASGGTQARENL